MSENLSKKERVQKYGEVFTPQYIVDKMCDALPADAFLPHRTFLEPACGDGVFVLEILRRKFANCKYRADYTASIESVYAMEIQEQNVTATIENIIALCQQHFKPTKRDLEIINDHVILCDSLKVMKLLQWWSDKDNKQ